MDLGLGYKYRWACSVFVEYIAKEQRQNLADTLGKCKFLLFKLMEALTQQTWRKSSSRPFILIQKMAKCVYVGSCYM